MVTTDQFAIGHFAQTTADRINISLIQFIKRFTTERRQDVVNGHEKSDTVDLFFAKNQLIFLILSD